MSEISAAQRWLLTLGSIQQRGHVAPTAILVQAATSEKPERVGLNGQMWEFWDRSTLTINADGAWTTPARTGASDG